MHSSTVLAVIYAGILAGGIVEPVRANGVSGRCTTAPPSDWLSIDEIKSKVQAQGYVVWKGRIEEGCADISAYPSATGALERLRVDPSNGRIIDTR